tara:strand:- start:2537 stop:3823 length:1287 start_codon:yes stop_codon:yes gene_type:complete
MEKTVSWGNFPKRSVKIEEFNPTKFHIKNNSIPYGNGRSYGDSCISDNLISLKSFNKIINYDKENGEIIVEAGILVKEILKVIIKDGWFLPVVAGTKLITVGGAIASDVHGKNHHLEGCFSQYVKFFKLMLPDGKILKCSKEDNYEFFLATSGGMGLTGIITEAKIKLKKINSSIVRQTTIKTKNLEETFNVFDSISNEPYSVAWIDCLSNNKDIGRALITYGEFLESGNLSYNPKRRINIPFYFPSFLLNKLTVKIFNWFYYNRIRFKESTKLVDFDSFFFPLDKIKNWNRIYGRKGFLQYQFILPKNSSYIGLYRILEKISDAGKGSFLAVLKLHGIENSNYLSFPIEGYSLALDFKIEEGIFELLNQLDKIVVESNGRIYLTKDSRVSKEVFERGYPKINLFRDLRKKYKLTKVLASSQSKRIEI